MKHDLSMPSDLPPGLPSLQQHPFYARAVRQMGGKAAAMTLRDGPRRIARAQFLRRRLGPVRITWIPRGPLWEEAASDAECEDALTRLLNRLNGGLCLLVPDTFQEAQRLRKHGFRSIVPGQQVAELDLSVPPEAQLAAMHGKWRNRLRHAERKVVHIRQRPFDPSTDDILLSLEARQRAARRYSALPSAFTEAWASVNPGTAQLFQAEDASGTMLAFVLILTHAPTATYHIGWSNEDGRKASCHNLLLWRTATWLAQEGYKRLDLGLVDAKSSPGLARFKLGIGAAARSVGPTMLHLPLLQKGRRAA